MAVRNERVYLLVDGVRVTLDEASMTHLLTAAGECHWRLATGEWWVDTRAAD